jgi:type II secretory pathway component PulM
VALKINLSQREQRVLIGAGVIFVLMFLYLGVDSVLQRYEKLGDKIVTKRGEVQKISRLRTQYMEAHKQLEDIKAKLDQMEKGFSVLSFIEDLANRENIRENIGSVKPKKLPLNDRYDENIVELKIDNVSLSKLVDFIFKIENSGYLLKVKRLRVKTRYDNRDLLNVTLQVTTYKKKA